MIQEKALLHYNKFKSLRKKFVRDSFNEQTLQILKVRLIKLDDEDYRVKVIVEKESGGSSFELDSIYANAYLQEF